MSDNRTFYQAQGFRWSFYQIHLGEKMFEIDVKPFATPESKVIRRIFKSGSLPEGVNLNADARIGGDRWKVQWSMHRLQLASLVKEPFDYILTHPGAFRKGWEEKSAKHEAALNAWMGTPQERFGGRTPRELLELGSGPYEITGVSFVWVGSTEIQSRPLFNDKDLNKDVRWYFQRGASLGEALDLMTRQRRQLNIQMIVAFASALGGVGSTKNGTARQVVQEKILKSGETAVATKRAYSDKSLVTSVTNKYASSRTERRIQELGRKIPVPFPVIPPLQGN